MKKFIALVMLSFAFAIAESKMTPELQHKMDSLEDKFANLVQKTEEKFKNLVEKTESLQNTSMEQQKHIKQLELELRELKSPSAENNSILYTRMKSVCPGNEVTLTCPEGQTLLLQNAEYGEYWRNCATECCTPHPYDCAESMPTSNTDEWILLKVRCDNRTTCSYTFQGSTFMEECTVANPSNYLSIYYACQPDVPRLVGFTAYATDARAFNQDDILLFDGLITNLGNFYDSTTSIFICPVSGVYMFSVNILSGHDNFVRLRLMLDDKNLGSAYATLLSNSYQSGSVFAIAECQGASKLWVRGLEDGSLLNGNSAKYSTFSGYLLHELS